MWPDNQRSGRLHISCVHTVHAAWCTSAVVLFSSFLDARGCKNMHWIPNHASKQFHFHCKHFNTSQNMQTVRTTECKQRTCFQLVQECHVRNVQLHTCTCKLYVYMCIHTPDYRGQPINHSWCSWHTSASNTWLHMYIVHIHSVNACRLQGLPQDTHTHTIQTFT